jgi:hypothetical protein
MYQLISIVSVVAMLGLSSVALAQAGDPPVKMSRTGICRTPPLKAASSAARVSAAR